MKEIKSLIWLEWKKSSVLANGVFTAAFIILVFLATSGLRTDLENLPTFGILFIFSYLIGLLFLVLVGLRAGQDLKTDEFVFLLLSPVKPWKHIVARAIFSMSLLFIYFLFVALIPISFFYRFWVGEMSGYFNVILAAFMEHFTLFVIPLVCFSLLSSVIIASYKKSGRRLAQIVMGLSVSFFIFAGYGQVTKLRGTVFPDYKIEISDAISLNPELVKEFKDKSMDGSFKFESNTTGPNNIDISFPIMIESQLFMLLLASLSIVAASQVWKEVEL